MTRQIETTILIVGTGGNAIAAASMLQRAGLDDLIIIGKHGDFGGAWYQNKYPGCGTDAEIALYQLGFAHHGVDPRSEVTRDLAHLADPPPSRAHRHRHVLGTDDHNRHDDDQKQL